MCVRVIVYTCRTHTQHRTVLIIFPPNLQTIVIIIAQMMSIGRERDRTCMSPTAVTSDDRLNTLICHCERYFVTVPILLSLLICVQCTIMLYSVEGAD